MLETQETPRVESIEPRIDDTPRPPRESERTRDVIYLFGLDEAMAELPLHAKIIDLRRAVWAKEQKIPLNTRRRIRPPENLVVTDRDTGQALSDDDPIDPHTRYEVSFGDLMLGSGRGEGAE